MEPEINSEVPLLQTAVKIKTCLITSDTEPKRH
jgi:hypothetical protein